MAMMIRELQACWGRMFFLGGAGVLEEGTTFPEVQ